MVQSGASSFQWYHESASIDLSSLFRGFYEVWSDSFGKDIIPQVIGAYTFAKDGSHQGTLTLAQTALQTLAWAVLGNRRRQLSRKAFDQLSAAERIRMLLNWADVPTGVPADQSHLAAKARSFEGHKDGPQAMVWTRNKTVHPPRSPHKRRMMSRISVEANYLALWYLDLVLLRLFDHQGDYVNWAKGIGGGYLTDCIEQVPWTTATIR